MKGNTVSIKGNITRDAEIRSTQNGNSVVSWGIAWNTSRKTENGGYEDVVHFFDCQCWATDRQLAYIQPLLVKGATIAITEAHLVYNAWTADDGSKRSKVLIQVDDPIAGITIGQKAQNHAQGGYAPQTNNQPPMQQQAPQVAPQSGYAQNQRYAPQQNYTYTAPQGYAPQSSMYDDDIPF